MSATITWVAGDGTEWPLDRSLGVVAAAVAVGFEMPETEHTLASLVSTDGALLSQTRRGVREVSIPFELGPTADVQALARSFASSLVAPGTLRYTEGGLTSELRNVIYESGFEGLRPLAPAPERFRSERLELLALDPWWHRDGATITVPLEAATDWNAAIAWNAALPWNGENTVGFTVAGDADVLPLVTITGAFTTMRVTLSGGTFIELTGALASGDVVTVDSRPGQRGPRLNGGPIDWSLLTADSTILSIPKGPQSLMSGFAGTDGSSNIEVTYDELWLAP